MSFGFKGLNMTAIRSADLWQAPQKEANTASQSRGQYSAAEFRSLPEIRFV
jgi:hypothetical protein